jgi:hypothetical protein
MTNELFTEREGKKLSCGCGRRPRTSSGRERYLERARCAARPEADPQERERQKARVRRKRALRRAAFSQLEPTRCD